MATSKQIKAAIERCVDSTKEDEKDPNVRARDFVARLSGALECEGEKQLADKIFSLLGHKESDQ